MADPAVERELATLTILAEVTIAFVAAVCLWALCSGAVAVGALSARLQGGLQSGRVAVGGLVAPVEFHRPLSGLRPLWAVASWAQPSASWGLILTSR